MSALKSILLVSILIISGCATQHQNYQELSDLDKKNCEFLERDLTRPWDQRIYFCLPKDYKGKVKVMKSDLNVAMDKEKEPQQGKEI